MNKPVCPHCGVETQFAPLPPWDARPMAETCDECQGHQEMEADRYEVLQLVQAAARSGRFDLI